MKVAYECEACEGTGLYCGFMEAKGEAVVCVQCDGTGRVEFTVKAFTRRKGRRGITKIRFGTGMIFDAPTEKNWMTYAEFKKRVPTE